MQRSTARTGSNLNTPAFLALGCIGFIASAPALAQDKGAAEGEKQLKGMTVTDTAINEEGYKVERVESPKAIAPLLDTPRSIVVIDKQVIKETGSATLVDALRTVPGITMGAAEGGNPIGDRPFIRGFDTQGSTFLDGVRDIGAQTREIFAVEQVQVVRGSDSTLGGRGSAGGSINVISKLPEENNFGSIAFNYGTSDYKRITGDANYRLSNQVAVRLNAMWHDQDVAGRDAIFQKRWGVAPSITVGMDSDTKLTAAYYHLHTNELPDSGIPYLYVCSASVCNAPDGNTLSQPAIGDITTASGVTGHVSRDTYYGLKDRDFRHSNTDQFTLRAEHDFGSVKLRHTARYSHTQQNYSFLLPDDSTGNVFGNPANLAGQPGGQVWRRANTRYGYTDAFINQTDLYGTFHTGSIKHSFAIGGELSSEDTSRGAYVLATGSTINPRCSALAIARYYCASLFNPNPNDPWINYTNDTATGVPAPIVQGAPSARTLNNANTKSVYAFDSVTLTDQLILNLGVRYDRFRSTQTLALTTAGVRPKIRRVDHIFNYQVGGIFKPTENTSLYVSYATAATPPNSLLGEGQEQNGLNAVQAATDALRVEKTKSLEAGAKADLFGGGLSLTAAVFQTKTRNARVTVDAGTVAFVGSKRTRGVELGFNGNITDEWNIFGGYTYLDAKIVNGGTQQLAVIGAPAGTVLTVDSINTGKQFPQTAKHTFTLWTNYKVTPKLSVGGGAFYSSRVYGGYADNRTAQLVNGVPTLVITKSIARSVPSYWRFDARAGYAFSDNVDLSVNVQNLTNKTYFNQAYSSHYAAIAPGRSAFATLTFKY